jgi:hypothetical protein
MARKILTGLEVAIAAVEGDVATNTEATARLETRRYDVRQFGTTGTADDSGVFQDAIDAVALAGGGTITGPAGTYTFITGLASEDGVYLDFPGSGSTHFDFSGIVAPVSGCAIYSAGSLTALPALNANIALHGRTITFASAPSVAAGDVLVIYNSADSSFNPARTYYRAGEYVRVASLASNTVTLTTRTYAAYASGGTVSVYKMTPIRTGISGARMTFKAGVTGIKTSLGSGLAYSDLILRGSDVSHLTLDRCYGIKLAAIDAFDAKADIALNYGVTINNSQAIDIDGCFLETTRHGLTLTGNDTPGVVPNREITVRGGRISGLSTVGNTMGCDMHGNVEYVSFVDVDMPHGCMIAGDHTSIKGGRVRSGPDGVIVALREPIGWSHEIDTTMEATADIAATSTGFVNLSSADNSNITRADGLLRVAGTLDLHAYAGPTDLTFGVYAYNRSTTAYANDVEIDLTILGNGVFPGSTGVDTLGIWVRSVDSSGFRNVTVSGRLRRAGVKIQCLPEVLHIHDCHVVEAPWAGIENIAIATPAYSNTLIRSHDNRVHRAGRNGIHYQLLNNTSGRIESFNDEATDCNQTGSGTSYTSSSIYFDTAGTVVYRQAVVGDTQSVPTQLRRDAVLDVGTLIEEDIINVGTVTTTNRATITTHRFRGRGTGAPSFTAAVGSTYLRTDGGASTTMYVNEAGTSTWRAV